MKYNYAQLAINTFHPQMIVDVEDDDKMFEVCKTEILKAGYPINEDNEDEWLEYIYMAQEMCEISKNGHVYKRERNSKKRNGWEYVLYTRENHPAYENYQ